MAMNGSSSLAWSLLFADTHILAEAGTHVHRRMVTNSISSLNRAAKLG